MKVFYGQKYILVALLGLGLLIVPACDEEEMEAFLAKVEAAESAAKEAEAPVLAGDEEAAAAEDLSNEGEEAEKENVADEEEDLENEGEEAENDEEWEGPVAASLCKGIIVLVSQTHDLACTLLHPKPTRTLQKGNKGEDVKWVQCKLNARGASLKVDGDFGDNTKKAVESFQNRKCLKPVDGIVGKDTRAALS